MISQSDASKAAVPLERDWRAQALEQVLQSRTFAKAEQLRNFLRYVCEMDIAGKSHAITEYSIGVDALGRGRDFVPAIDGIVRNRAHGLRQKLLEYYTEENPTPDARIDLPKGSYVPRFTRISKEVPEAIPVRPRRGFLAGFLAASALCSVAALAAVLWLGRAMPAMPDPIMAEAWGPLATPGAHLMIVLGMPRQFVLRAFPAGAHPSSFLDVLAPPSVAARYNPGLPRSPGDEVHLGNTTAIRIGEVRGAISAIRTLDAMGVNYEVLQDAETTLPSMRGRNVLLFGDPNLVPAVEKYLERGAFAIEYDNSFNDFVVRERHPKSGPPRVFTTGPKVPGNLIDFPGLLTVLPSDDSSGANLKTVVFACANSAGCQAAAEFFTSPRSLRELKARFQKDGIKGFPAAYQVVVRATADALMLLSFRFETYQILEHQH